MSPCLPVRRPVRVTAAAYRGGLYFVTVCAADRPRLFGRVADGLMCLSPAGRLAVALWRDGPLAQPGVVPDVFVVMPDHVHVLFGIAAATTAATTTARSVR